MQVRVVMPSKLNPNFLLHFRLNQHILIPIYTKQYSKHYITYHNSASSCSQERAVIIRKRKTAQILHYISDELSKQDHHASGSHDHAKLVFLVSGLLQKPDQDSAYDSNRQ